MWYLDLPLIGWLCLALLAYSLVTAVLYVAAAWLDQQRRRHDQALAVRRQQLQQRKTA